MTVEEAKKILFECSPLTSSEKIRMAAKFIFSELENAQKKILHLADKVEYPSDLLNIEDLPGEIWKDIEGYEGLYQVSNMGRVKSFFSGREKIKKLHMRGGYWLAKIKNNYVGVHILVAKAFIPNPENKSEVNHLNGKSDNRVSSLEWVTHKENMQHAVKTGLQKTMSGTKVGTSKLTESEVKFIRENFKAWDSEFGAIPLAKKFNVDPRTIRDAARKKHYK